MDFNTTLLYKTQLNVTKRNISQEFAPIHKHMYVCVFVGSLIAPG